MEEGHPNGRGIFATSAGCKQEKNVKYELQFRNNTNI